MSRYFPMAVTAAALIAWTAGPVQAEGFYVSGELGMNFADALKTDGHDTDRASVCDEYINPRFGTVNDTPGWENTNCTGPNRGSDSVWENRFGSDEGVLFGSALGYHIADSRFRVELEYFYRNTGHEEASGVTVGGGQVLSKVVQEIVRAEERIGDVSSHNLFANVYMDFRDRRQVHPVHRRGASVSALPSWNTAACLHATWTRPVSPPAMPRRADRRCPTRPRSSRTCPAPAPPKARTSTIRCSATSCCSAVDYTLTDSLLLGLKGRWVSYDSFKDKDEWDQLRSHPSNLRRDGGETVVYDIRTDDIELFGVSLSTSSTGSRHPAAPAGAYTVALRRGV